MSIGIDIGKYKIKIVELSSINGTVEIKKIGSLPVFENINNFNLEKISKAQLSACLQDLCKNLDINPKKTKNIITSISGALVDIREVSTLDLPDNELSISLELEAKKHIPLDGTDAIIDYHHLGANKVEIDKINVILTSTTKNIIQEHASLIQSAGFKPNIFDSDPIALSNLFQYNYELPEEGANIILDIGNSSSTIIVWGKNSPFFTRNIEIGGDYFTKEIMRSQSIDYESAEKLKYEKGTEVFSDSNDSEADNMMISIEKKTVFNDLTDDIKKTLRFYIKNNGNSFFNTCFITGGSAALPGVESFISSTLGFKVEKFNPCQKINNSNTINNINEYSTCIGLALRGLES